MVYLLTLEEGLTLSHTVIWYNCIAEEVITQNSGLLLSVVVVVVALLDGGFFRGKFGTIG